jgi:uncharacterized membrane protein YphA (DoxX/SURF4 family)
MSRAVNAVDWISAGYRPSPAPLAILRVSFALYVLINPRDIMWIGHMQSVAFAPPPGPFALLPGPPSTSMLVTLAILRAAVAIWVLIGWKTRTASAVLSS